jgi:hypothetical protein
MAGRKKGLKARELSPGQAAYVLERLVRDRRVSQSDVNRYVSEMSREISDLESQLRRLRDAVGGTLSAAVERVVAVAAPIARRGRKAGRKAGRRTGRPPGRPRRGGAAVTAAAGTGTGGGVKRRRRATVTEEQLASRKLQGRYLSLVRQFPAGKRAQFAKTAKDRGREAAIKEMSDQLKK